MAGLDRGDKVFGPTSLADGLPGTERSRSSGIETGQVCCDFRAASYILPGGGWVSRSNEYVWALILMTLQVLIYFSARRRGSDCRLLTCAIMDRNANSAQSQLEHVPRHDSGTATVVAQGLGRPEVFIPIFLCRGAACRHGVAIFGIYIGSYTDIWRQEQSTKTSILLPRFSPPASYFFKAPLKLY